MVICFKTIYLITVAAVQTRTGSVLVMLPYSGSSPLPLAERPARSSAATPPSGTDMFPCATWRCFGPGALKYNHQQKPITSQLRSECYSQGCVKVKTSHMKYATGKEDLFTELSKRRRGGYTWAFLTGKRLVDIPFYSLQEAHSLRLRQSQSSYDTNAWSGGGAPSYSVKQRSHFLGEKY